MKAGRTRYRGREISDCVELSQTSNLSDAAFCKYTSVSSVAGLQKADEHTVCIPRNTCLKPKIPLIECVSSSGMFVPRIAKNCVRFAQYGDIVYYYDN